MQRYYYRPGYEDRRAPLLGMLLAILVAKTTLVAGGYWLFTLVMGLLFGGAGGMPGGG